MARATRAAAAIQKAHAIEAELRVGPSGSFEVAVDGTVVAKKRLIGFPSEKEIVKAVGEALGRS